MKDLSISVANEINERHERMELLAKEAVSNAIRIGELLSDERKHCKYGEWLPWLKANIVFTSKTAENYIRVYKDRTKLETVSNLTEAYRIVFPKRHIPFRSEPENGTVVEKSSSAEPEVALGELSISGQAKVNQAIKILAKKLRDDFDTAVKFKVNEILGLTIARIHREQEEAKRIFNSRNGIMTRREYNQIRACLHTDRTPGFEEKKDAFILFTSFEKYLLKEKDSPTKFSEAPPLPTDAKAWDAWRKKTEQARKRASVSGPDSIMPK